MIYPEAFKRVLKRLINVEGGFTADPKDRGNWTSGRVGVGQLKGTKGGISAMTYPTLDIAKLTHGQIEEIYFKDWWLKLGAEYLPAVLVYQVWQFAINAGMANAKKVLQRALGVTADGVVGPKTIDAIAAADVNDLTLSWFKFMILHYTAVPTWNAYGKGWMNRTAEALAYAAEDN